MQDSNNVAVKGQAKNLNVIVMERLRELQVAHDNILENAKRRVEKGRLDKIKQQIYS